MPTTRPRVPVPPLQRVPRPFLAFIRLEAAGGFVLSAAIAMRRRGGVPRSILGAWHPRGRASAAGFTRLRSALWDAARGGVLPTASALR